MKVGSIDSFSPRAQVWVFGADRDLAPAEELQIREQLGAFVRGWKAHEVPLRAAAEVVDRRFVIAAVDEQHAASGCSIDKLFGVLRGFEQRLGVSLLDTSKIWFRDRDGSVQSVTREEFRALAESGGVDAETTVFDFGVSSLADLHSESFARPAAKSWHSRYLTSAVS